MLMFCCLASNAEIQAYNEGVARCCNCCFHLSDNFGLQWSHVSSCEVLSYFYLICPMKKNIPLLPFCFTNLALTPPKAGKQPVVVFFRNEALLVHFQNEGMGINHG